jgi:hypothetical protein
MVIKVVALLVFLVSPARAALLWRWTGSKAHWGR